MGMHNLQHELETAILDSTGRLFNTPSGYLFGWGTTPGNGFEGWAPGALYIDLDAAADATLKINEGTATTASWIACPTS